MFSTNFTNLDFIICSVKVWIRSSCRVLGYIFKSCGFEFWPAAFIVVQKYGGCIRYRWSVTLKEVPVVSTINTARITGCNRHTVEKALNQKPTDKPTYRNRHGQTDLPTAIRTDTKGIWNLKSPLRVRLLN